MSKNAYEMSCTRRVVLHQLTARVRYGLTRTSRRERHHINISYVLLFVTFSKPLNRKEFSKREFFFFALINLSRLPVRTQHAPSLSRRHNINYKCNEN